MSFWNRLRIVIIFFQLVKNPNRTDLIFKGVEISSKEKDQEPVRALERLVLSNDEFNRMYDENYLPVPPRLEDLSHLSRDSFGYQVYLHMHGNGLGFEIFPQIESSRAINYLSNRLYQDHDLWHVLLGYGIEIEDELAVQAFGVAQFQSPVGTLIIAGGLLHLLAKNPARAVAAFEKINEGYAMGRKAKFLLSVRLHDLFAAPLEEVRQRCGIK